MTQAARGDARVAPARRRGRPPGAATVLDRVRVILEETCEQDGRPPNLQEVARRKAYRQGINHALAVIHAAQQKTAAK